MSPITPSKKRLPVAAMAIIVLVGLMQKPVTTAAQQSGFMSNSTAGYETIEPFRTTRRLYPLGYTNAISPVRQYSSASSVDPNKLMPVPVEPSANPLSNPSVIRIGLALNVRQANVVAMDELEIRNCLTGACLGVMPAGTAWKVSGLGSDLVFTLLDLRMSLAAAAGSDSRVQTGGFKPVAASVPSSGSFTVPVEAQSPASTNLSGYVISPRVQEGLTGLNGRAYRGALWLRTNGTRNFSVINFVGVEDYLLSVVPSEMPSRWPIEALKAQAIAARSYTMANVGKHGSEGYDLKATVEDQVYSGVMSESSSGNQAVAATTGIVLKNQGKIIPAYYHSTSGGATASGDYVWGKSYPFLQEVIDYDDASPKFTWTKKVPLSELDQVTSGSCRPIGSIQGISVLSRASSNRNTQVLIAGTQGSKILTGEEARGIFGLPSSSFNVYQNSNFFIFSGRGFGHGLGLSQWGAKALAEHGYNAAQILSYYYKDVLLDYP